MSEQQLTPEQVSAENKLICEKLLGLHRKYIHHAKIAVWADEIETFSCLDKLDTWAEAGVILDHIQRGTYESKLHELCGGLADDLFDMKLTPAKIRAAALELARSLP